MRGYRFGTKIKQHSTLAIKRQLLTLMFEDEIRAIYEGGFHESNSPAVGLLRQLKELRTKPMTSCSLSRGERDLHGNRRSSPRAGPSDPPIF